jgi:hypothetical protein
MVTGTDRRWSVRVSRGGHEVLLAVDPAPYVGQLDVLREERGDRVKVFGIDILDERPDDRNWG